MLLYPTFVTFPCNTYVTSKIFVKLEDESHTLVKCDLLKKGGLTKPSLKI